MGTQSSPACKILTKSDSRLNDSPKFWPASDLDKNVLDRTRTVKYKLFGFIEIDNQSIKFSPELN